MQNNGKEQQKGKTQKAYLPTKITLTIHTLVGAYLLYTAYSLIGALKTNTGKNLVFFAVFMLVFTVVGIILVVRGVKGLVTGKYVGGALDPEENEVYDVPKQDILEEKAEDELSGDERKTQ